MERVEAWRITSAAYRDTAFTGRGAELYGGRFNPPGLPAVYTSATLSLALLELLVQVDNRWLLSEYYAIRLSFDAGLQRIEDATTLPVGWDSRPAGMISQEYGTKWLSEAKHPVLRVPSVVVPVEYNYVLNPRHPRFSEIEIGEAERVPFDPRFTHQG